MNMMVGKILIQAPEDRVPISLWLELRAWMLANDSDAPQMLRWAEEYASPPTTAVAMAHEIIWIILCAGKTAQAARTIEKKVLEALWNGEPVVEAFGHRSRAAAIEMVWAERVRLFDELSSIFERRSAGGNIDDLELLAWARAIPWVGDITAFQLMKNFGIDCPKPDIWLCRLAGIPDKPQGHVEARFAACRALCLPLAESSGDRIATVDTLLWLACNKGALCVSPEGGPVSFQPRTITAMPIMSVTSPSPQLSLL